MEGLFKREVPEVAQGAVEIKAIEREPGNRSKIAVSSNQSGIDPVGSCVGQKGVRVQAIIQEDPKNYVTQALSPAKQLQVEINEKEKTAKVFVAPEELSLAIGRDGQNVRLASKLTGYRIEIEGKDELSQLPPEAKEKPAEKVQEEKVEIKAEPVAEDAGSSSSSDDAKPIEESAVTSPASDDVQKAEEETNVESSSLNESQSAVSEETVKEEVGLASDSSESGQSASALEPEVKTEDADKTS